MSKFRKRIAKLSKNPCQNALVVGDGFGYLHEIIDMFQTVFIINKSKPTIKSRNLVYKETFDDMQSLIDITHIFFDLKNITDISSTSHTLHRWKPIVIIEGNEIPNAVFTRTLLDTGYKCYKLEGLFHPWELK